MAENTMGLLQLLSGHKQTPAPVTGSMIPPHPQVTGKEVP